MIMYNNQPSKIDIMSRTINTLIMTFFNQQSKLSEIDVEQLCKIAKEIAEKIFYSPKPEVTQVEKETPLDEDFLDL